MVWYLLTFLISISLLSVSRRVIKTQQIYIEILAIILPCLLAGFRSNEIGTDTMAYLEPIFNAAKNASGFNEYMNYSWYNIYRYNHVYEYEIGFTTLIYITSKIFHNIVPCKFFVELLIIVPIFIALKKYCKNVPLWLGMGVFYFLFFNQSLNLMRQYIAMSFLFLAIVGYMQNKKIRNYISFQVIAMLFHSSSLIGIVIILIMIYINYSDEKYIIHNNQRNKVILVTCFGLILLVVLNNASYLLSVLGMSTYIGYVNGTLTFMPNQIIVRLPILFFCWVKWKILLKQCKNINFYICMVLYTIIFSQLAGTSTFGVRISVYFSIFLIAFLPQIYNCSNRSNRNIKSLMVSTNWTNLLCNVAIIFYIIFYWWFYYINLGSDGTMPYKFF